MITLRKSGSYKLIETRRNIKILYLDKRAYAWVEPWIAKGILVLSRNRHTTACVLSIGDYCLYDVVGELRLPDGQFLDLEVGDDQWQGYVLVHGLPTAQKKRVGIAATSESVTNNPAYTGETYAADTKTNDDRKQKLYQITHNL